jgi:hypothetical protein
MRACPRKRCRRVNQIDDAPRPLIDQALSSGATACCPGRTGDRRAGARRAGQTHQQRRGWTPGDLEASGRRAARSRANAASTRVFELRAGA